MTMLRDYNDIRITEKAIGHAGVERVSIEIKLTESRWLRFERNIPMPCSECGEMTPGDPWIKVTEGDDDGSQIELHLCESCARPHHEELAKWLGAPWEPAEEDGQ